MVVLEPDINTASISSNAGYSCALTTSKLLSAKSCLESRLTPAAAVSSRVVKMAPYLPYFSTTAGGGVSHSRMAIRKGVFMFFFER